MMRVHNRNPVWKTCLAAAISQTFVISGGLFPRHGVPHRLIVDLDTIVGIDYGGKGGRNHDSLHRRSGCLDRFENASCPLDGRIQNLFYGVVKFEVERRCRVEDIVEWGIRLHCLQGCEYILGILNDLRFYLVEGAVFGDIFDNDIGQLLLW